MNVLLLDAFSSIALVRATIHSCLSSGDLKKILKSKGIEFEQFTFLNVQNEKIS